MVLISVVLLAAVHARNRMLHELADAKHRMLAVREADALLQTWSANAAPIPLNGKGTFEGTDLEWSTSISGTETMLSAQRVRMTVTPAGRADPVFAEIELLVPRTLAAEGVHAAP